MLMYDNEHQTKENQNWTKDKIEPQHIFGGIWGYNMEIRYAKFCYF